ncbi:hypothetical protein ILUMI_20463 [Ignelater luminosus]|uniref:SLC41A/MgtE integral membrane domain-containing protein n=1 Tax=Ignelater luminosus TaxID=2038154 RepID=A0A8K0FYW2_IGNLU|nr:hypothetical protein ILUMI_20463 [Ignelater luminosus]
MVGYSNFPKENSDALETSSIPNDCNGRNTCQNMDNISDKINGSTVLTISGELEKCKDVEEVKVESLHDVKSIDSIESVKSLESAKSLNAQTEKNLDCLKNEKWYFVALQVAVPFLIAGMGTIGAGLILGMVEEFEVFMKIDALFILVPAIIGLKGNLDMCLASRLSTQANLGNMVGKREVMKMIIGNIGLVQVQAIVAACVVSIYAVCISALVMKHEVDIEHAMLVICCSILTATLSCFCLDFLLTAVIIVTHRLKLNPDNLATPLAASIGDVVSLSVLSVFARYLFKIIDTHAWIFYVVIAIYLFIMLPFWIIVVLKNKYTKTILTHGWVPVLSALFISGMSGLVLDKAVDDYRGFVVFQPIVNGVGGNLVSVQASRISTMLHKSSLPGILPPHTKQWVWPWTALISGVLSAKTARILILMIIPGQFIFVFVADVIYNQGVSTVTPIFVLTYILVGVIQVMTLLYIAHLMIHFLWKLKIDPDNSAIPYLTALGDLLGSSFLLVAFMFLRKIGWEYTPVV